MTMKKHLFIIALMLISIGLHAQDHALLEQIRQVNSAAKSFESDLHETVVSSDSRDEYDGKLYFFKPDKFTALLSTDRYLICNADHLNINFGLFHGKFKLRRGMLRSLCNIFLYGFQGRCQDLAEENDFNLSIQEIGQFQQVTLTNKKRILLGLGYKKVVLKFEKESLKLKEISLTDNKDTVNTYTISNVKYNVKVEPSLFEF